jgi:hypothetical protein
MVEELAGIMGEILGWTDEQKNIEVQRTLALLKEFHGVNLA